MLDEHYINPRLVALYDLDSGWAKDRDFYLALTKGDKMSILDLGCGTGLLCRSFAEKGHSVVGVDPSSQMLSIGKSKPHGKGVQWVQSTAQDFHSENLFDLIIMTGHAFQTLLTEEEVLLALKTMKKHLTHSGKAVFESRNPGVDWSENWNYRIELKTPSGVVKETRRYISMSDDTLEFDLIYNFSDETLVSKSKIKFFSHEKILDLLTHSGLKLDSLLGDWDGRGFKEKESKEMIFVVSKGY